MRKYIVCMLLASALACGCKLPFGGGDGNPLAPVINQIASDTVSLIASEAINLIR